MSKTRLRLVIDTNVWISFLIGKTLRSLAPLLYDKQVIILFSQEGMDELIKVLKRPKLQKYFTDWQIAEFLDLIEQVSELITVSSSVNLCRDKKDNFLLALAKDGQADYLITGDEDLLTLEAIGETKIISYKTFKSK